MAPLAAGPPLQGEQFLILLLLAAAALLRNLFKPGGPLASWLKRRQSDNPNAGRPQTAAPPQPDPTAPNVQLRKLLEALGRPPDDAAPPALPPAPAHRPPVLTARPPALPGPSGGGLPIPGSGSVPVRTPSEPVASPPQVPAPTRARRGAQRSKRAAAPSAVLDLPPRGAGAATVSNATQLRALLGRPGSARQAVLLSEILGPPRALRLPAADGRFT